MRLVGLTGGIACGKSSVSKYIRDLGIAVIDCDVIARDVVRPGTWGYSRVVSAFKGDPSYSDGLFLSDGSLDREALGSLVFRDRDARRRLNAATHLPILLGILREIVQHWVLCRRLVVIDMPLLFETGFYHVTKPYNVVVACTRDVQIQRLMERDGLSSEAACVQRIDAQIPVQKKQSMANFVIQNGEDMSFDGLKVQVEKMMDTIRRKSAVHSFVTSPFGVCVGIFIIGRMIWG